MNYLLGFGLLLLCFVQLSVSNEEVKTTRRNPPVEHEDWMRKEVSALIYMTLEFVKDMDMKMRDVRRIERYYYGTYDFGAGRLFTTIGNKFDHMVQLYKNTSRITYILEDDIDLRSQVVGMLQFMLSDYNEFLSLIDLFKERYKHWKSSSMRWQIRDVIQKFLLAQNQFPYNWANKTDEWR